MLLNFQFVIKTSPNPKEIEILHTRENSIVNGKNIILFLDFS